MFGEKIKERRTKLGFAQWQLGKLIGVYQTTISQYENNSRSPDEKTILKLCKALECDANYLFGMGEDRDGQ